MRPIKKVFINSFPVIVAVLIACSENDNVNPDANEEVKESSIKFTSSGSKSVDHNREYNYKLDVESTEGDTVIYTINHPAWLNFDPSTSKLSGIAGWSNLNQSFDFSISATNLIDTVKQAVLIEVVLGEIICNTPFGEPSDSEYILPYEVGEENLFNQSYCSSNPAWGHHNWFAYDIKMDIGETIIASRTGEVIASQDHNPDLQAGTADCSGGKENWIFILHSDGTVMSYVHLMQDGITVNKGDIVEQGQVLGKSGNSGCSSGPHTHIALFRDRTNYDRQSTLPFNYKNAEGALDSNNGLVLNNSYTAMPF